MTNTQEISRLFYVGLESYPSRYTFQLTRWVRNCLTRAFDSGALQPFEFIVVEGDESTADGTIQVGQVLDASTRALYAMEQSAEIVRKLRDGMTPSDVIFFEDMFHPGFDGIAYYLTQLPAARRPRVYLRCLAQTIDPDDFLHTTRVASWMRHYEAMVNKVATGIFMASHEMLTYACAAGWTVPCYVTGLPYDAEDVARAGMTPFDKRPMRVAFSSRLDWEKSPWFLLAVARAVKTADHNVVFTLCSGKPLSSNDPACLQILLDAKALGLVEIEESLTKERYYDILESSRVLLNTSLQDWVSNTVSEADTLGCNVVFPAYRSFPEVFNSDASRLYVPWSVDDAAGKVLRALRIPHPRMGEISAYQSETVLRTIQSILGGEWINPSHPETYRPRFTAADSQRAAVSDPFWK